MDTESIHVGVASRPRAPTRPNQDAVALPDQVDAPSLAQFGCLYLLADGMGGHQGGEQASALAVGTTLQSYYAQAGADRAEALRTAVAEANAAVYRQAQTPQTEGMGSTLVAALILGEQLLVAHVGDSRAYLVRGGQAEALTRDHNWAEEILPDIVAAEEIPAHPYQRLLTRSIGGQPTVQVDLIRVALAPGDRVALMTDGVSRALTDADLAHLVGVGGPQLAADALVDLAVARGSHDDATALVLAPQPADAPLTPPPAASARRPLLMGVGLAALVFACLAASGWLAGWLGASQPPGRGAVSSAPAGVAAPRATPAPTTRSPQPSPTAAARVGPTAPRPTLVAVARLKGDVTGDGRVDIRDVARVGAAYGQEPAVDRAADVNGDNSVGIQDLVIVASQMDAP